MAICPICKTEATETLNNSPYYLCPNCELGFQDPLPPKTYEADHEKGENGEFTGHLMSENDKAINDYLAEIS